MCNIKEIGISELKSSLSKSLVNPRVKPVKYLPVNPNGDRKKLPNNAALYLVKTNRVNYYRCSTIGDDEMYLPSNIAVIVYFEYQYKHIARASSFELKDLNVLGSDNPYAEITALIDIKKGSLLNVLRKETL